MRKNGSRFISIKQYRLADLFLFAVILAVFELILHFSMIAFGDNANFTFSPMVPLVLVVMMRWGWVSVFYAVGDGALYVLLKGGSWQSLLIYCIGNACIMLLLLYTRFVGKEKIRKNVYLSILFVVLGWIATALGRSAVAAVMGNNFAYVLLRQLFDLVSMVIGIVIVLIMRRLDGMFEDQKHYLRRVDDERKEMARRDEFGDEPVDISEETLSILKRRDDEME